MRRRLISLMAALAIGTVGALAFAAPGNAATTPARIFTLCNGPEQEVPSKAAAESIVSKIDPTACLDIQFTDKCDGTTVVTMTNWAFNDNKFTVLTIKLNGKEYTLKGGSDPNTETVVLGPKVEDLQPILVFRFTTPGGTVTIEKNYGDPWTWEEPKACVSPSPSASATATPSPSPSVSVSNSAPASTEPPVAGTHDLPVTGASAMVPILSGGLLFLVGVAAVVAVWLRRRRAEIR